MQIVSFSDIEIDLLDPLIKALKLMDSKNKKLLIVTNNGIYKGLISIGDIQRYIISHGNLSALVKEAMRKNILTSKVDDDLTQTKELMFKNRIEFMPILNHQNKIVDILFWDDLFKNKDNHSINSLAQIPVVIMAGGIGSRLRPITHIIPKALIPLGNCSTIERIINQFHKEGAREFYATVNYKSEMMRFYFSELEIDYNIQFIKESLPLGTAGSLSLLKGQIHSTFFVSNCDILIEEKMSSILAFHRENHNEVTIVSSIYTHTIPYGTLVTTSGGILEEIQEKPELIFQVNTGIYILEPGVLNLIPKNQIFHITDLIMLMKKTSRKVGVYPINTNAWMDIGQWKDYRRTAIRFGDSFE